MTEENWEKNSKSFSINCKYVTVCLVADRVQSVIGRYIQLDSFMNELTVVYTVFQTNKKENVFFKTKT